MQQEETLFNFPAFKRAVIVETELMMEMEARVLAMHYLCLLCLWYGSGGEINCRKKCKGLRR